MLHQYAALQHQGGAPSGTSGASFPAGMVAGSSNNRKVASYFVIRFFACLFCILFTIYVARVYLFLFGATFLRVKYYEIFLISLLFSCCVFGIVEALFVCNHAKKKIIVPALLLVAVLLIHKVDKYETGDFNAASASSLLLTNNNNNKESEELSFAVSQ